MIQIFRIVQRKNSLKQFEIVDIESIILKDGQSSRIQTEQSSKW